MSTENEDLEAYDTSAFIAFLYEDGSFVFSSTGVADPNKTLVGSYTGWDTTEYTGYKEVPWHGNRPSIVNVSFEGNVVAISTAYWFYDCSNLVSFSFDNFDTSNVTTMSYMFRGCSSLTSLNVSSINTSNVIRMTYMFYNCSSLTSLDTSNFNTSKVTSMSSMFRGCSSLTSLNVSNFDTSNVTTMSYMFYNCSSLTSLDISNFDTSNVTSMSQMFRGCSSLTSLNINSFDTSNVTNMSFIFYGCNSITSLDVSIFDTSKVTTMRSMFYNCSSLASLDVSNFDISNVTEMMYMFYNCSSLVSIYTLKCWDNNPTISNSTNMFTGDISLIGGNGTTYTEENTDISYARIGTNSAPGYFTYKNNYPQQEEKEYILTIPSSVTNLTNCFKECTYIFGNLKIDTTDLIDTGYTDCFYKTATGDNSQLNVYGKKYSVLKKLYDNSEETGNIILPTDYAIEFIVDGAKYAVNIADTWEQFIISIDDKYYSFDALNDTVLYNGKYIIDTDGNYVKKYYNISDGYVYELFAEEEELMV